MHFVPERTLNEQPSAAPAGPLKPPTPELLPTSTPATPHHPPSLVPPPEVTPETPILKPQTPVPLTPRTDESTEPASSDATTTSAQ